MDIRSRQDVREFLQSFEDSSSTVLSTATDGYHYHLVEAATPVADADILDLAATVHNQVQLLPGSVRCVAHLELPCAAGGLIRLSLIEKELKEHGFLAPLQPWEHRRKKTRHNYDCP